MTTPKNGNTAVEVTAPVATSVASTDRAVDKPPSKSVEDSEPKPTQTAEEEITQAIQVLSTLATLKLKTQESKDQSLTVLRKIESLFKLEEPISPEDLEELKTGFKTLNKFALAVNQYYETKTKAEDAKKVLDGILGSFKSSVK
ncbi:MAG: hypothetical protein KME45_25260 [Stenomitos rutilans HA7619-LM2]|jgi:hypothetical protein|nr:hypothetical protein [Stenomitos rutilans HA7619-LM2]